MTDDQLVEITKVYASDGAELPADAYKDRVLAAVRKWAQTAELSVAGDTVRFSREGFEALQLINEELLGELHKFRAMQTAWEMEHDLLFDLAVNDHAEGVMNAIKLWRLLTDKSPLVTRLVDGAFEIKGQPSDVLGRVRQWVDDNDLKNMAHCETDR